MLQEWDFTLSPPGMSPPHVFHDILYLPVKSADRCQLSHIATERQHWGPATPLPHLRGSSLTIRECNAPTQGALLTTFSYRFHHQPPLSQTSISPTSSSWNKLPAHPPLGSLGTASTSLGRRSQVTPQSPTL